MMKHHGHSGSVVSAAICKGTKVKMEAQDIPHTTDLVRKINLLKVGVMVGLDWHNDPSDGIVSEWVRSNKSQLFLMEHSGKKCFLPIFYRILLECERKY